MKKLFIYITLSILTGILCYGAGRTWIKHYGRQIVTNYNDRIVVLKNPVTFIVSDPSDVVIDYRTKIEEENVETHINIDYKGKPQ